MRIIGLGGLDHNGSATVFDEGVVHAFLEVERVTRHKNQGIDSPTALHAVLDALDTRHVNRLAVADRTFWHEARSWLPEELQRRFGDVPVDVWAHHECHAMAAFAGSGFAEATCVTIDGKGDGLSSAAFLMSHSAGPRDLFKVPSATSVGRLWWAVSEFCGLPGHHSAGKIMALAAFGTPRPLWKTHLELLDGGAFRLNPLDRHPDTFREVVRIVEWLADLTGREPGSLDADVAASVQALTEVVVRHLVQGAVSRTGCRDVCLAGGVALNGLANQMLMAEGVADRLYVPPCTDDRGLSLGAAARSAFGVGQLSKPDRELTPFLGPELLDQTPPHPWRSLEVADPDVAAARAILDGEVVGVCRGRDEAGPRALGHRSLLASPTSVAMRDYLNHQVKRRESFRPFGIAILEEAIPGWVEMEGPSPYMLRIGQVHASRRDRIPAAVHTDGTTRVQSVGA